MKTRRFAVLVIVLGVLGVSVWLIAHVQPAPDASVLRVSGTIEVTDAEVSFRIPGRVEARLASEGDTVTAGAVVARLDPTELQQEVGVREAELHAAEADLAELAAGSRPEEIAQAEAAVALARSEADRWKAEHARQLQLFQQDGVSAREQESAQTSHEVSQARVREAAERLALLRKGPRAEQIAQTRARVERARRALDVAQTRAGYATLAAPFAGCD